MTPLEKYDGVFLSQEFHVDFTYQIAFIVAPWENKKAGLFMQNGKEQIFDLFQ